MSLLFGPDPSSGDMCKLGGCWRTTHPALTHCVTAPSKIMWRHSVSVCSLASGWMPRPTGSSDPNCAGLLKAHRPLRELQLLLQENATLIAQRRPTVSKNSCGYNLFGLADGLARGCFDLPKLFVGSEGTLGLFSEATIRLVEKPRATLTALIHFHRLEDVGDAVPKLLELSPSALEVMDANTLNLIGRAKHGIPAEAAATLLVELDADGAGTDLRAQAEPDDRDLSPLSPHVRSRDRLRS